jgi:CheY-like chemotaxis protein
MDRGALSICTPQRAVTDPWVIQRSTASGSESLSRVASISVTIDASSAQCKSSATSTTGEIASRSNGRKAGVAELVRWRLATMPPTPTVCQTSSVRRRSVLIVDDHEGFRRSASRMLQSEGFEVVGTVSNGIAAISAVSSLSPDVVLLDIQLPDEDGFAVALSLAELGSAPAVVLTSSRSAASFGGRVEQAPVRGFLAKHELSGATLASFLD